MRQYLCASAGPKAAQPCTALMSCGSIEPIAMPTKHKKCASTMCFLVGKMTSSLKISSKVHEAYKAFEVTLLCPRRPCLEHQQSSSCHCYCTIPSNIDRIVPRSYSPPKLTAASSILKSTGCQPAVLTYTQFTSSQRRDTVRARAPTNKSNLCK